MASARQAEARVLAERLVLGALSGAREGTTGNDELTTTLTTTRTANNVADLPPQTKYCLVRDTELGGGQS